MMAAMVIISQMLLYVCFAIVLGSLLVALVPLTHRPDIHMPKGVMATAVSGIILFSLIPIIQLILSLDNGGSLLSVSQSVLFTFELGKAWIFTFIVTVILFLFIFWFDYRYNATYAWISVVLTLLLILTMGWSSHASSHHQWKGLFNHTAHVTVVSVWAGILLVMSWFSKNHRNWTKFLSWFTPVAIVCFLSIAATGLVLMSFGADLKNYANGWPFPYGQALLIKHLLIIPLLLYAGINSWFIKKRIQTDPQWDPRPWAKIEGILILLIFSATAVLSEQSSPQDVSIAADTASSLFTFFYQGNIQAVMPVEWAPTATSISFFLLASIFIVLMAMTYTRKLPSTSSFFMGVMIVICGYFGIIFGIQ